ncbi:MAG: retroviral-like aspartic protease [Planctomycetes bacterium]|nr:retroviral-like aspartic protease [Planctomycetota bacterium]
MSKRVMGKIIAGVEVFGDRGKTRVKALLDSGAGLSLIRRDVADRVSSGVVRLRDPQKFRMADGRESMSTSDARMLVVRMKGRELTGTFYVIDDMPRQVIIGVDFLQTWEIALDMKTEDYRIHADPRAIEIA